MNTKIYLDAAHSLSSSATVLRNREGTSGVTVQGQEQILALGIAADWLRWSSSLSKICFRRVRKQSRERIDGMEELTRFYYAWTAANALFGRPTLLTVLDPTSKPEDSELIKFTVLYSHANALNAISGDYINTLHRILFSHIQVTRFPWQPGITSTPILDVIYRKYSDPCQYKRGNYKTIAKALSTNTPTLLDLPLIIYLTRNWTLHGSLLNSGLRGPKEKFGLYIDTVNQALADIMLGAAKAIATKI